MRKTPLFLLLNAFFAFLPPNLPPKKYSRYFRSSAGIAKICFDFLRKTLDKRRPICYTLLATAEMQLLSEGNLLWIKVTLSLVVQRLSVLR